MKKTKVLVIDDDATICEMLKVGLETSGYIAETVTNESDFWSLLEKSKPNVILMDVGMPGLDGISLCRNLRLYPELKHIPIVIITAFNDESTFHDAMLFGANDFMTKPFDMENVKQKIDALVFKSVQK